MRIFRLQCGWIISAFPPVMTTVATGLASASMRWIMPSIMAALP